MRWAGWLLAFWVACGGSGSGGGGGTDVVTDGGVGTDGGVAAECVGLVPAPPGTAIAFDIPVTAADQMCGMSVADGAGVIAASVTSAKPQQWWVFEPSSGAHSGTFEASSLLFPQPEGFMGLSGQISFVTVWDGYGKGDLKSTAATAIGPAFGSGAIALSADSASLTVTKVDAQAVNEVGSATVAGTFTPLTAAEDSGGAVLALTGNGSAVSGIWVDMAKQTAGQPFAVGTATSVKARPLLGSGIAIQLDGRWAGVVRPGEAALRPPPAWLGDSRDFIPARGGSAYAVMPVSGNSLGIVSAQGNSCGSIGFPGVTDVSVGIDGTVVGSTGTAGCTKYVWRNVLR